MKNSIVDRIKRRAEAKGKKKALVTKPLEKQEESGQDSGWESGMSHKALGYSAPEHFEDYGLRAARIVQACALSAKLNGGQADNHSLPKLLTDVYKEKSLANLVTKDFELRNPNKGGALAVPEVLWGEFVPYLRSKAPIFKLGARVLPMKAGLWLPGMAAGTTAGYIGEMQPPAVTDASFNDVKLTPKKLATKTVISQDLLEETSYDILEKIREDLVSAMGAKMTEKAILGKGTDNEPGGILKYAIQEHDMSSGAFVQGSGFEGMEKLWDADLVLEPGDCGWLMNPRLHKKINQLLTDDGAFVFRDELKTGMFLDSEYAVWNGIPVTSGTPDLTYAIFGYWKDLIVGVTRELEISTSNEAAFRNASGTMVSAWDVDAVLMKLVHKHDFAVRRNASFVLYKNINVD